MTLLAIVLALVLLRFLDTGRRRSSGFADGYLSAARGAIRAEAFWISPVGPALVIAAPALALGLFDQALDWYLQLPLSVLVLWLCLGPRELAADARAWLAARDGDAAIAEAVAVRLWGTAPARNLGALFVASHERLFGVLFWFCVLGPAGALLYRFAQRLTVTLPEASGAVPLHAALAAVPARLTAVTFAMAGSADDVIAEWRRQHSAASGDWMARTWIWLTSIAAASVLVEESRTGSAVPLTLEESVQEFVRIEARALLILLAVVAIFTVGNWSG